MALRCLRASRELTESREHATVRDQRAPIQDCIIIIHILFQNNTIIVWLVVNRHVNLPVVLDPARQFKIV